MCLFIESKKVTVHWKDKWRMGDVLKRKRPRTWGCRVDVICDFWVSFFSNYLLHRLFSWDVVLVGMSF